MTEYMLCSDETIVEVMRLLGVNSKTVKAFTLRVNMHGPVELDITSYIEKSDSVKLNKLTNPEEYYHFGRDAFKK